MEDFGFWPEITKRSDFTLSSYAYCLPTGRSVTSGLTYGSEMADSVLGIIFWAAVVTTFLAWWLATC